MRIGLISDTHDLLESKLINHLREVDEIWHAGDIGSTRLLDKLKSLKPTVAVYGNIDGHKLRAECNKDEFFEREGIKILMTHIAGSPPRYNARVLEIIRKCKPKIFICGHSHILKIIPDKQNDLIFMNPGATGNHGFHKVKTFLRLDLEAKEIKNLEVVEFGIRGRV